jgi:hypothetical protein
MNNLKLRGTWEIRLKNKLGEVIDYDIGHNIITDVGKEGVARLIFGDAVYYFSYIAIGTGLTGETASDTTLDTEVQRGLATLSYEADNKAKFIYTFTFGSAEVYAITELGIFNDVTGGTMLNRFTTTAKNVDSSTDLEVTIKIEVL